MIKFVYRARFAFHLWWNVPGMSPWEALAYPCDPTWGSGDPREDADAEMAEMTQ